MGIRKEKIHGKVALLLISEKNMDLILESPMNQKSTKLSKKKLSTFWRRLLPMKCDACYKIPNPPHERCCWDCENLDECYLRWLKGNHYCPIAREDKWCSRVKLAYKKWLC